MSGVTKRFAVRRRWREMLRHPLHRPRTTVLRGVDLEVPRGQIFGVLGPNGAGKTTLFKILATLIVPDEGRATVLGHDVLDAPAQVRRVLAPVLGDDRSLYWRLTARDNLRLFAALHGLTRTAARQRVAELLDVVGLEDAGSKLVGAFSSGMKQRLLLARALLSRPSILLLDEPTRSLDPLAARDFRRLIRADIVEGRGITALLATHSTEEAAELCDRIGILHRGRLVSEGSTEELAARFMGDRYRVWARNGAGARLERLVAASSTRDLRFLAEGDGWTRFEVEVPGGSDTAADLLARLHESGVRVARFEKVPVSLAELMERIVSESEEAP